MRNELGALREQMKTDFQATMLALSTQRDAVKKSFRRIARAMKDVTLALNNQDAAHRQHIQKTDQRFDEVLGIVDRQEARLEDHERRLNKLEGKAA